MALLTIDGVAMPEPNKFSIPMSDLSGGDFRNEDGVLFRSRVRQGIAALALGWTATGEQAAVLLRAIVPDKVTATYFDPREGGARTADMYVSDRSCDLVRFDAADPARNLWAIGFSLNEY